MSKRVTAQDGKIELIVADGASDIDIGADGTLAGSVNLGARVSVDNNGNIVIQDSTDTYTWTIAPQAGWIDINASDPGNTEYGMYFDTVEIGVYDYAVTAPSQPPIAADGAFESKFNIWSRANPTEYEIAAFGFSGGPDLEIYNGIRGGNINFYAFNDAGAAQSLITLDPDTEQVILPLSNVPASPTLAFGDGDSGLYESTDDSINVAIATLQKYTFNATGFSTASSFGSSLVFGNPTATVPTVVPNKGDADTGLGQAAVDQLSLVAGGVEMLRLSETGVATTDQIIIGPGGNIGSTTNPALALDSTGVTGFSGSSTELHAILNGARQWYFSGVNFRGNGGSSPVLENVTPTSTDPNIIPNRTDLNTGIGWNAEDQLSLIAGGKEMLRLAETGAATTDQVIISPGVVGGSAAATPTLAFGDGDTGFYETLDDILSLSLAGTQTWNFASGSFEGNATDAAALLNSGATATVPTVVPVKTDTNTGIGSAAADQLSLITGGIEANRIIASTLQTTTAATTEIESIAVPSDEGFGFEIHIMGTDDTNNDVVFERIFGAIYNATGTTALVGSTITDRTDTAGASGWVITVAADDAGDTLTVDVTGAAVTIDWKCRINILNV